MPHASHRHVQRARRARQDPMLTRLYIGVLGMFPMVTAGLLPVVHSLLIAAMVAGLGAVTFMSILPRGDGRRS